MTEEDRKFIPHMNAIIKTLSDSGMPLPDFSKYKYGGEQPVNFPGATALEIEMRNATKSLLDHEEELLKWIESGG